VAVIVVQPSEAKALAQSDWAKRLVAAVAPRIPRHSCQRRAKRVLVAIVSPQAELHFKHAPHALTFFVFLEVASLPTEQLSGER
jgi:hypothetical protein